MSGFTAGRMAMGLDVGSAATRGAYAMAMFGLNWWADFGGDKVWDQAESPVSSELVDTHPQAIMVPDGAGGWTSKAANVLCNTSLGLQTVPTRTNLVGNNTGNLPGGVLMAGTATVAPWTPGDSPANDNNAKLVTQGSGASDGMNYPAIPITAGLIYTYSASLKYNASTTWVYLSLSDNVTNVIRCWINIQTMTIGSTGFSGTATFLGASIVSEGNGWYRVSVSGTMPNTVTGAGLYCLSVSGNTSTTRAAGNYGLWLPQVELGTYSSPPIITSGSSVTRTGNQQVISGFGTSLNSGFAGFIKVRNMGAIVNAARCITIGDGTANNLVEIKHSSSNNWRMVALSGGAVQCAFDFGPASNTVDQTIVFASSDNFFNARIVGQSAVAADTAGVTPDADRIMFLEGNLVTSNNNYQLVKKLGLKYGPQDQASFDALYARAAAA